MPAALSPHEVPGEGAKAAFVAAWVGRALVVNAMAAAVRAPSKSRWAPLTHLTGKNKRNSHK